LTTRRAVLGREFLIDGLRVLEERKNIDERGFFAELFREEANDFLGENRMIQVNLA